MRIALALLAFFAFITMSEGASAQASPMPRKAGLQERLVRLETQLEAEQEAHDRQADAFDATISRIEFLAFALVVVLTLAAIVAGILTIRWVQDSAKEQVQQQVKANVEETGEEVFATEARALREEYEEKFADLYRRFARVVEEK
jgi:uncharacterized protein HemX